MKEIPAVRAYNPKLPFLASMHQLTQQDGGW